MTQKTNDENKITPGSQVWNILKCPTSDPIRDRQNLIREQRVYNVLIKILDLLARFVGDRDNVAGEGLAGANLQELGDLKKRAQQACRVIYFLIEVSFAHNHDNALHVARWMDVMIKHVELDIGSDRCLTQMLDNNEDLLNEKVEYVIAKEWHVMAEVHDVISVSKNKKNLGVSTSSRLCHGDYCQNCEIKELLTRMS